MKFYPQHATLTYAKPYAMSITAYHFNFPIPLYQVRQIIQLLLLALLLTCFGLTKSAYADEEAINAGGDTPQKLLHILDYVSVEYGNIVQNGKILDSGEYDEQVEFAQQFLTYLQKLPEGATKQSLSKDGLLLQQVIRNKGDAKQLSNLSANMSRAIIENYRVEITPRHLPDLGNAAPMFQQYCSACHGESGLGDGVQAAGLEPQPANFHLQERQQFRNIYSLYNTISMGVNGTAMRSFNPELSDNQRWQLAFYVSNFYASPAQQNKVQSLQGSTPKHIINLRQLTQITPNQAKQQFGEDGELELLYLRNNPSALQDLIKDPFLIVEDNLRASVSAHQAGNFQQAYDYAVAAYLEGFELVEPKLKAVDRDLLKQVENAMKKFREMSRDKQETVVTLQSLHNEISKLVEQARVKINDSQLSQTVNFVSTFLIILREGVEAILVLAAIFAVLTKSGRREMSKYLHLGWLAALALGAFTWFVAANIFSISGASRELSEGITAIVASAMLVYVGFWLHRQSTAKQWQSYIHEKINQSLSNKAITGLALIAFLAVYREVFETILFINTLWLEADHASKTQIVIGAASAMGILVLLAWGIFKFSLRLPLKLFFRINAIFLYALAVVFAGKGIAALQEAGKLPSNTIPFIEIDALGIYPNLESLSVQAFLIVLALIFYLGTQYKSNSKLEKV